MADYPASFKAVSGKQNTTRDLNLVYIWKKPCNLDLDWRYFQVY